ncbi:MAG: aminotransferase class III-fold pyridoxal phosphate-dependent enzyme [Bacteroidetes bacterium]|nr:aminotransferase class III-fold pyridoxal phosphate-dependent enzyme [Bacteroidota bacterium]
MDKQRSAALVERRKNVVPNGISLNFDATAAHAKGALLVDMDGNEYIDFVGGIGVNNSGHCPAPVIEAIVEQSNKLIHGCFQVVTYEPYVALAEKLAIMFPHGDATKVMITGSGAESVENAIKIARQATKRRAVLCYTGAFHGRTNLTMALTSKIAYKKGCGPFAPEVYRIQYPNYYRYGDGLSPEQFADREIARLREAMLNVVNEENLAAIIIELVQGEGGFYVAPQRYVEELRKLCDEKGICLIFDEVQTGFGRTSKWGAYQHYGVVPDISTWAKSLGAGMPIGCVIGKAHVMDAAAPGTIGGTYPGNPVACAAALANLKYMEDIDINGKAAHVASIIWRRFTDLQRRCPAIGDVRGLGAMIAFELVEDKNPRKPAADLTSRLVKACYDRGLLILKAGTHANIIRVLSPLVIDDALLNRGLDIIEEEMLRLTA